MVLSNIFRWHASHGLRNKVFWLIVLPVFSIMVFISVLTVLNKIAVERELLQDRVKTYARLLEGGDLSLESVEDSTRLESFLTETVRYAGLFNREQLAVYETGKKRGAQYAPVVDPRRVDQAFEGYDITSIETRGDAGSILGTYYPIIVDGTVVSVLHVEASFERST